TRGSRRPKRDRRQWDRLGPVRPALEPPLYPTPAMRALPAWTLPAGPDWRGLWPPAAWLLWLPAAEWPRPDRPVAPTRRPAARGCFLSAPERWLADCRPCRSGSSIPAAAVAAPESCSSFPGPERWHRSDFARWQDPSRL